MPQQAWGNTPTHLHPTAAHTKNTPPGTSSTTSLGAAAVWCSTEDTVRLVALGLLQLVLSGHNAVLIQ